MTTDTRRTSWHLARLADCYDPDAHDGLGFEPEFERPEGYKASPGAEFLRRIEEDVLERLADGTLDEDGDAIHEIADSAVPIYTHDLWTTFTDLGAYNEDPSELGAESDDMTRAAGVCLYLIAERLARAIAEDEISSEDEDEDEEV